MLGSDARFQSIYTEYIDAKSLASFRDTSGRFNGTVSDAHKVLSDMASALAFIHDHKVVHNDVKMYNIMYNPERGAVLIDFGLSLPYGRTPSTSCGTPWYLPPEFVDDWTTRGPSSDVWALGVVLLWMLGRIPFPEKTPGWSIGDIHYYEPTSPESSKARRAMRTWTNQVIASSSTLGQGDGPVADVSFECVVKDLLAVMENSEDENQRRRFR